MNAKHILVPTDFSPCAHHALTQAVELADTYDAHLHVLHVINELNMTFYGTDDIRAKAEVLYDRMKAEAEAELRALAPLHPWSEVKTTITVDMGFDVASTIEEYIKDEHIDLVVMGTYGRESAQRIALGSVTERLVRRATCPVLTVGEEAPWAGSEEVVTNRVLAPVDFSEDSKRALRTAKRLAATYDADLDVLFVAEQHTVPVFEEGGTPSLDTVGMSADTRQRAEAALKQVAAMEGDPDLPLSTHVQEGRIAHAIVDFAETHGTDLIVMAPRGLSGMDRFVLGSSTERVMRAAPCPVLVLHPSAHERASGEPHVAQDAAR